MTSEIKLGCIDDLIKNINLIKELIPEKSNLTKEEIYERLIEKNHGVIISKGDKINGLHVWYEENNSLYLWLGAISKSGEGIGSKMLSLIENTTNYSRWFVKIHNDNEIAKKFLHKKNFKENKKENKILYLEKFF